MAYLAYVPNLGDPEYEVEGDDPCASWFSSFFFQEYLLTASEVEAANSYFEKCIRDVAAGAPTFYFEIDSPKAKEKDALVQSFNVIGYYVVRYSHDFRSLHNRFIPENLSTNGIKYLVVLKELLDRLCALMYGLDWGVFDGYLT